MAGLLGGGDSGGHIANVFFLNVFYWCVVIFLGSLKFLFVVLGFSICYKTLSDFSFLAF